MLIDFDFIDWDDVNENHIAAHELTPDDVENVLRSLSPITSPE